MNTRYCLLPVVLCFSLTSFAQTNEQVRQLTAGQQIEREIAGGVAHTYQVQLTSGQFLRVVVEQKGIDVSLALAGPDGTRVVETDLTGAHGTESLAYEAAASGDYRLMIRAVGPVTLTGTYDVRLELRTPATAQDKKRIVAERLLTAADKLSENGFASAQQSLEQSEQALVVWRELGDRYWEAKALSLIGYAGALLNRHAKAAESYAQELQIRREFKDRAGEAGALGSLGAAYNNLNRYQEAIDCLTQALEINRELKNSSGQAFSHYALGFAYIQQGRLEQALESFEGSLDAARAAEDRDGEVRALRMLGNASRALSRYDKSIAYYEQALKMAREVKNRQAEGQALWGIGMGYHNLGRPAQALSNLEQALAIFQEIKYRPGEVSVYGSLGNVYLQEGMYEEAIKHYEDALNFSREMKHRVNEGVYLHSLGAAYASLGRYDKAIEYYEQALQIRRAVKARDDEGRNLSGLGNVYKLIGRYDKAVQYLDEALAINREVKDLKGEADTLNDLGDLYRSQARYAEAMRHYENSLAVAREIKAKAWQIDPLDGLGEVFRSQGQHDKAIQFYEQAIAIARETKKRDEEAAILNHLMLDWRAQHKPRLAVFYGKQSVNTYQELRNNIRSLDAETQRSFLKSKEQTYRALADLLISEGRLPEAEQVIRMLKEEEYFEYIRRDLAAAPQGAKAQLTPEEAALEKRYREISEQLAALGTERGTLMDKKSRTPEEEQRLARLDADLVVAGNAFQKFLDQLATELGSSSDASGKVFQLRESQGLMEDLRELGKGTVALYTLVGEDKYRVILTTADFQKGYEYPIKAADLNRKVLEFRDVLQNPKLDPLPLAQELYRILLGPVAKDLAKAKAQTIMWSLDGVLRYVPVSALNDGKHYLVEQYQNVVFTPASQARLKDAPARNWDALGLGVSKAHGERIPALPGVLDEMRGIIRDESTSNADGTGKQTGVLPGVVKLDEQFTQEAMLTQLRQRPKVVHIASHFQFSPGNETNSALLLGDGTFLSLAQIKSLPNIFGGVDLLTLSACNTATGGSGANGKEVEGFGVLAQRQGAKAVVASLWPVADRSTKELMQDFYRLREAQAGTSKAEALRQAQLILLRGGKSKVAEDPQSNRQIIHDEAKAAAPTKPLFKLDSNKPYAHPYYWAPFILIGNWK